MAHFAGISPVDFWQMSPAESWCIYDAHRPQERVGTLLKTDFDRLKQKLEDANAKPR